MKWGQKQYSHFRPCQQKPAHKSLPLSTSWLKGDTPSTWKWQKPQSTRSRETRATTWSGSPRLPPPAIHTGLRRKRHALFYVRPLRSLRLLDDATRVAHRTVTCTGGPSLGEGGGPRGPGLQPQPALAMHSTLGKQRPLSASVCPPLQGLITPSLPTSAVRVERVSVGDGVCVSGHQHSVFTLSTLAKGLE